MRRLHNHYANQHCFKLVGPSGIEPEPSDFQSDVQQPSIRKTLNWRREQDLHLLKTVLQTVA